jgi:hypothetical protein
LTGHSLCLDDWHHEGADDEQDGEFHEWGVAEFLEEFFHTAG